MSKRLSFSIAVNLLTENFKKGTNTVKNSLRSMQMQVLTFAAALGAGGLGLSGLISRFRDVARETNRVITALKNVSNGTNGFADNLRFVNDLANKYGLEVNALIGNFSKFTASATQANMPMEQQKKVFESVSRAITAFGLSASEADGVMLALSQMMSKGKISMEELRTQMGEKLPVAIQAMAKALGVSIGEMEKLIGSGKVMSADVLPKFADALNAIIPNVDTDNLETSLSRLSNAFGELVNASDFQNKYKSIVDRLTGLLRSAMQNIQNITLGIVAVIVFAFTNGATKIWRGWWAMADHMTNKTRTLNITLTKAIAERVEAEKALETSRLQHSVAIGKKKIKLAKEIAMKEKLYAQSVLAEDRARLAFTQASSQASSSLWNRSFNTIKVGAAKLSLTLKSLWNSFYPALLITIITTLGYKIYELATATTKAEDAMRKTNDAFSKAESNAMGERRELARLRAELEATVKGSQSYNNIRDEIISKFGQYYDGLSSEIDKVGLLATTYDKLTRAIRTSALARAKDEELKRVNDTYKDEMSKSLEDLKSYIDSTSDSPEDKAKVYQALYNEISKGNAGLIGTKQINRLNYLRDKKDPRFAKEYNSLTPVNKKLYQHPELYRKIQGAIRANSNFDISQKIVEDKFPNLLTRQNSAVEASANEMKSYGQTYNDALKEYKQAKAVLENIKNNKSLYAREAYEEAVANLSAAKSRLENLGGNTSSTINNDQQKIIDNQLKLQNATARAALDARKKELENQEALLKLDQDGFDKQQKQIDLNHKKEILGIDTRTQDLIEKQQNAERQLWDIAHPDARKTKDLFKTKTTSYEDLSDNDKASLITENIIATRTREKENADLLKKLLKKYQDYKTQRVKLEKDYNEEITFLESKRNQTNDTAIDAAIAELVKQRNKALSSINLEEFQDSIDWSTVFGNLDKISTNALEDIRGKLKTYLDEVGSSLSPTDLQTVTDAMEKMNLAIADRSPINELKSSYDDYKKALIEVIAAKEKLNGLEKGTAEYSKAAKELTDAENKSRTSLTTMSQSMNSFGQKGNQLVNSGNEIIDMLSAFGVEIDENVSKTLAGVGQVMSGMQNIDLTKPFSIITSSITMLTGAGKAIAGVFGLFGGGDNNSYQQMKERYDALNKVWDELISKKKEYISTSYGDEARKVGQEAQSLVEKKVESSRTLGKEFQNSFKNKGGKSWGRRQRERMTQNEWNELDSWATNNNISKADYDSIRNGRMNGLFDLSADQLEKLKDEAPTLWAKLNDETQEYLDNIISGGKQLEDINKSLKEQHTQVSFDSFRDNFVDLLSDMDSSSKDFADNFEKYIQKAILTSLIGTKYKSQIESLYDDFANANSDGNIDALEASQLKRKQDELVAQMLEDRDKLKESMGWDSSKSSTQDSTKGYSVSMDQETGGAILGRITGIHESIIKVLSMVGTINVDTAKVFTQSIVIGDELKKHTEIFHEMQDVHIKTYRMTEKVNENILSLLEIKNDLSSINKNTKGLAPR